MIQVAGAIERLEEIFPARLAVEGDSTGSQIVVEDHEVRSIGVCYEVTDKVLEVAAGVDLLVAFHPLIFSPLSRIAPDNRVGRCVLGLIESNTPLFVTHTRLDAHPKGTNRVLSERLGLSNARPLVPDPNYPEEGMGVVAEFTDGLAWASLVDLIARVTSSNRVVASDVAPEHFIRRVALIAGSGMSYFGNVIAAKVDAFITGDVKYHDFHASLDSVPIVDPGHAESERFVVESTVDIIRSSKIFDGSISIVPIELDTRPGVPAGS